MSQDATMGRYCYPCYLQGSTEPEPSRRRHDVITHRQFGAHAVRAPLCPHGRGCMVRSACAGTKRDGHPCAMPPAKGSEYCYLHDPDPAVAKRRSRNASRAATAKHSSVARELREIRDLILELLELTIADRLQHRAR